MKYNLFLFLLIFSACSVPPEKEVNSYEDIRGFFAAEAIRLGKADPEVKKTVARNDSTETRAVRNINWETELSLFTESDINKPAWRDSYQVSSQGGNITYLATDTTLKTREIQIQKDPQGRIRRISIRNQTNNMLYSSSEQLMYVPDSVYQISKRQHVILVGNNRYLVKGLFTK
jgi:hypothetical protein